MCVCVCVGVICDSLGAGGNVTALLTGSASSAMYQQHHNMQQFFIGRYVQVSLSLSIVIVIVHLIHTVMYLLISYILMSSHSLSPAAF